MAVDVVGGIGFGVAFGLDVGEGVGEADALAHRVEDVVRGRVQNGLEAEQAAAGQAPSKQAEDRTAVHQAPSNSRRRPRDAASSERRR